MHYRYSTGEITKLIETDVLLWLSFEDATILFIHYRLEMQPYGQSISLNFVNTILGGMRRSGAINIDMKTKMVSLTVEGRELFQAMCAANSVLADRVAKIRDARAAEAAKVVQS
jgi:hypothetical protein